MDFLSPPITAEDTAAATENARRSFSKVEQAPVEAGRYTLTVKTAPALKVTKNSGTPYILLVLGHTGEIAKTASTVFHKFFMTKKDGGANPVAARLFGELLLGLGVADDAVIGAQWDITEATNGKGDSIAQIKLGNGEIIAAEDLVGKNIGSYLKLVDGFSGGKENEVGNFVAV